MELFTAALRFMCAEGLQADLINTVLEVDEDGRVQRYPFPDG